MELVFTPARSHENGTVHAYLEAGGLYQIAIISGAPGVEAAYIPMYRHMPSVAGSLICRTRIIRDLAQAQAVCQAHADHEAAAAALRDAVARRVAAALELEAARDAEDAADAALRRLETARGIPAYL